MLFIDYSSAFNTIVPTKLITKLRTLGLNTSLCNWILDFLTGCPQVVRVGNNTSATLTHTPGAPQGGVLSPLLYSLFTYDCVAKHDSDIIIRSADDTMSMMRQSIGRRAETGSVVAGQQPLPQCEQDKGAEPGLHEKAA